jgi:hypothetical protein
MLIMSRSFVIKPKRVRRMWDLILTIILFVLYLGGVVIGSIGSAFVLAFSGDSCGVNSCNYDQMGVGFAIAVVGIWLPVLLVVVFSIVLLVMKRIAFWVPLAGMVLSIAIIVIGFALAFSAVASFT